MIRNGPRGKAQRPNDERLKKQEDSRRAPGPSTQFRRICNRTVWSIHLEEKDREGLRDDEVREEGGEKGRRKYLMETVSTEVEVMIRPSLHIFFLYKPAVFIYIL